MMFRRRLDERQSHHPWSVLDQTEVVAALLSLFVLTAGVFVIILVDTWLGVGLIAVALVAYFVLSALHIGRSRKREAAQLAAYNRSREHRS